MDELPNIYTEFGAVIAELGRQTAMALCFFLKYQDRILFGKTPGFLRSITPIFACWKAMTSISLITKNTTHTGTCMAWG